METGLQRPASMPLAFYAQVSGRVNRASSVAKFVGSLAAPTRARGGG